MNIFKITYVPKGSLADVEAFVVTQTWESLVAYVHANHERLLSAYIVNISATERDDVIIPAGTFS